MDADEGQGRRRLPDSTEAAQKQVEAIPILWEIQLTTQQPQPDESRLGPGAIQVADELSR